MSKRDHEHPCPAECIPGVECCICWRRREKWRRRLWWTLRWTLNVLLAVAGAALWLCYAAWTFPMLGGP